MLAGHGRQGLPNGYTEKLGLPEVYTWAPPGTTFVMGVNALLNAVYTFVGQALVPSFVGDMERPEDFPKALYVSMTCQIILYTIVGAYVYSKTGQQYTTAPAYGSLIRKYGRVAAGFTMPTIVRAARPLMAQSGLTSFNPGHRRSSVLAHHKSRDHVPDLP